MISGRNLIRDRVDVTSPLHWDCRAIMDLLLSLFPYLIEISEDASTEWSDDADAFVPTLGGWFLVVMRKTINGRHHFPNARERRAFNLPGELSSRGFEYGSLEAMLDFGERAKRELAACGFKSVIVFRPGPLWLPRRQHAIDVPTSTSSRGAA